MYVVSVADIQRGEKEGEKEIEAQPELVFNGLGNNKVIEDFTKGVADVTGKFFWFQVTLQLYYLLT